MDVGIDHARADGCADRVEVSGGVRVGVDRVFESRVANAASQLPRHELRPYSAEMVDPRADPMKYESEVQAGHNGNVCLRQRGAQWSRREVLTLVLGPGLNGRLGGIREEAAG